MKHKFRSANFKLSIWFLVFIGATSAFSLFSIAPSISEENNSQIEVVLPSPKMYVELEWIYGAIRPYDDWGKVTKVEAIYQYQYWLIFFSMAIVALTYSTVYLIQHKRNESALMQTQEELRKSKQLLQLVMDNIPQFIFWKDRNSVYLGCNQNFSEIAGIKNPDEIKGKTDYDLVWKEEETDFFPSRRGKITRYFTGVFAVELDL